MADDKSTSTLNQVKTAVIVAGTIAAGVHSAHNGTAGDTEHLLHAAQESQSLEEKKKKKQISNENDN